MSKNGKKSYLEISKQARAILNANVPVDVAKIKAQTGSVKNIKTKKEALATSAFWLAVARSLGENIPAHVIEKKLNKLKGKNNASSIEIRQELNDTMRQIKNKQIMVKIESETDLTTLYEVYKDTQGNKFYYEDGELKHTEIYGREESYDLSGEVI